MSKRIVTSIIMIGFVLGLTGLVSAQEEGSARKGKYTYQNVYKACNERGAVASAKPTLNPDAKTQAQWKALFDKKQFDEFGCKEEWSKLTEQELKDIFSYLNEHAADSATPAKCQ